MKIFLKTYLRRFPVMAGLLILVLITVPGSSVAEDDVDALKRKLKQMSQDMEVVKQKLDSIEKKSSETEEQIDEMDDRLNKTEVHTATDKIAFGIDFRSRADSLHYQDLQMAPANLTNAFFIDYNPSLPFGGGGLNNATLAQIQAAMQGMKDYDMIPPTETYDAHNDLIWTNKLRLDMSAKVNNSLSFSGRLAAYKVFGDSTGVKFNQGSLGDVSLDGNSSSSPHGDIIHLERAYFIYKKNLGSVPTSFSLGRRPSNDGAGLEYMNNSLQGGSPVATIINWQFDGASYSLGLEDVTGIPGAAFKLCYGVGFEGDWGNSYALARDSASVRDVHMFGFIADLYDNDSTGAVLNYAHAWGVTDGFAGTTVMPFIVTKNSAGQYNFAANTGGYISRMEPFTEIGDWDAASLLLRTNLSEGFDTDIDLFLSGSWSHTKPSQTSQNPYYEIMGMGLLNSNGDLEERDGYMVYLGAVFPGPWDARIGLEYNYGSQYWFNFTGAEDSLVGSKLAARGQVYEGYWHQPLYGNRFFATLGARYYDYEYTGSGNPLGEPVEIDEITSLDAMMPVVDEVWDAYLSFTFRY